MAKIYDSIMSLIKPGRIATAATTLDENEHKVTAATEIILPTLLAEMLKKGATPEIGEVLTEAKKIKAWENYDKIWRGSGVDEHVNIGERMENRLLSPHDPEFNAAVGAKAGMKAGHADRLTNWIAGTIAAWVSSHAADSNSYKALLADLAGEKADLRKAVPADIVHMLGLAHTLGVSTEHHKAPEHHAAAHKAAAPQKPISVAATRPQPKRSLGWLWWLLGIIALALIIFFCMRSCGAKKAAKAVIPTTETVTEVRDVHVAPKFEAIPMTLPDGTKITMYRGNLEEAVKAFLDSDKYKNATEAELRSVWFEFSDINFEHNRATELMTGSPERLVGLVNTLKNYPAAKIKVGAFADKTGTSAANYNISLKRAETIKATLVAAGVPQANVSIEGFGEKFAKAPADAADAVRALDRDIAMRFTK